MKPNTVHMCMFCPCKVLNSSEMQCYSSLCKRLANSMLENGHSVTFFLGVRGAGVLEHYELSHIVTLDLLIDNPREIFLNLTLLVLKH